MKKILILTSLLTLLGYGKDIPVELGIGISSGYDKIGISEEEINRSGLSKVSQGSYKESGLFTNLSIEGRYPIKLEGINVKVGAGVDAFVENNISVQPLKANKQILPKNVEDINNYISEKNELINKETKDLDVHTEEYNTISNMVLAYKTLKTKYTRDIANDKRTITKIEAELEKYKDPKALEDLKKQSKDAETEADKFKDQEDENKAKYKELKAKYDIMEDSAERLKVKHEMSKAKVNSDYYHNKWVESLAKRRRLEDTIELVDGGAEKIAKLNARIKENEEKSKDSQEKYTHYKAKFSEYKKLKRESTNNKTSLLNEVIDKLNEEYKQEIDEILVKLVKKDLELDIEDSDTLTPEELSAKIEEKYKELTAEELKERKNDNLYNITKEDVDGIIAKINEKYPLDKNYDAKVKFNNLINKQVNFGGSLYGIVEVEKELLNDLYLFANIRSGIRINNNPLYQIATEFEKDKVEIDGIKYVKPEGLLPVKVKGFVKAGIGAKYKGARLEVYGGYNHGLVGVSLGYDF